MPNGIIMQYAILFNPPVIGNKTFNEQMGTVEGLELETEYALQLTAFTKAGEGPPANVSFITRKSIILCCVCVSFIH